MLKQRSDEELARRPRKPLKIQLVDGKTVDGSSWQTTPFDVAKQMNKNIADSAIVAKVNNELWDLDRPLEDNCQLQLLNFDDLEGQQVFWHSTAHVLGEALENIYGSLLCYGPPIANGFYYDLFRDGEPVGEITEKYLKDIFVDCLFTCASFVDILQRFAIDRN